MIRRTLMPRSDRYTGSRYLSTAGSRTCRSQFAERRAGGCRATHAQTVFGVGKNPRMSYDLAVWEGDRPANDVAAAAELELLYSQYFESEEPVEPTPRIVAYLAALLARYPDIGPDTGDNSPWASGPLLSEARGPLVYFPMVWSRCDEVSAWAAQLAADHALNCYDPQKDQLRTPWGQPWRFELTSAQGGSFRDPDHDRVRKVVTRISADNYFAVLTRADDWYVQVGYGERAHTRPVGMPSSEETGCLRNTTGQKLRTSRMSSEPSSVSSRTTPRFVTGFLGSHTPFTDLLGSGSLLCLHRRFG
jgi:hypothetical protein